MVPLNVDTMLLIVGLVLLLVNVIIGAILLRRGRVRASVLNVLLALGACAVVAVGLVGFAFSAPAPVAAAGFGNRGTGQNAAATGANAPADGATTSNGTTTGNNRGGFGGGAGRSAIQTQIAEGTIPAPLQTATAGGGFGGNGAANAVGTAPANGTTTGGNRGGFGGNRGAIQTQIAEGTIPAPLQTSVAAGTPLSAAFAGRGGNRQTAQAGAAGGATPAATEESTPAAPANVNAGSLGGGNAAGGGTRGAGGFGSGTTTAPAGTIAGLPFNLFVQIATVIGGILIVATGLALFLAERDHDNFNPSASGGLLNMGAGAFVIVAAIVIPILPAQFTGGTRVNAAAAANVAARVAARSVQTATPTETLTATGTATPMPSLTPAPSSTPVILVTQVAFGGTPMSTATACILTTNTLAYLRGDPSAKNASIGNIFPGSLLQVTAQSTDKKWWKVLYTDNGTTIEGWVDNQFVTADSACNGGVALVGPTTTPTRTPRPTSTPLPTSGGANTTAANKPGGTCTVTTTVAVSVRPDPSLQQAPVAQVAERTALIATEKTANGWYHVEYSSTANGWVGAGAVFAERACDNLTVVAAP